MGDVVNRKRMSSTLTFESYDKLESLVEKMKRIGKEVPKSRILDLAIEEFDKKIERKIRKDFR